MLRDQEEMTRLGFWGLAPFVVGAAVMWVSPFLVPQWAALNIHMLVLTYAGVIAAFLAGTGVGVSRSCAKTCVRNSCGSPGGWGATGGWPRTWSRSRCCAPGNRLIR